MARHINAELIEKHINREEHHTPDEKWRPESEFAKLIDSIPTADVVEVVHGEWEEIDKTPKGEKFACSECHKIAYFPQPTRDKSWQKQCPYKFCPNCGAKMDGKKVE